MALSHDISEFAHVLPQALCERHPVVLSEPFPRLRKSGRGVSGNARHILPGCNSSGRSSPLGARATVPPGSPLGQPG